MEDQNLDSIITAIRAGIVPGASSEARAAGAAACRAVLAAFDATPGEPMPPIEGAPAIDPAAVSARALLAQLGRIPAELRVDVALDLAIAKLRTLLPADGPPIEVRSIRFPLVPLGAHVPPARACASCGESDGHGWGCETMRGRAA